MDNKKRIMSMISRQGGKSRLYKTIIPMFPPHLYYAEVFGGAGWTILNKNEATIEVFNDIEGNIVNLFRVIRDFPGEFANRIRYDVVSRMTFDDYKNLHFPSLDNVDRAVKWYYVYYNSFNSDMSTFLKRNVKSNPNRFLTRLPKIIGEFSNRMTNVIMENLDFRDLLKKYDNADFLFYLDPPYYGMTGYEIEFSEQDHIDLASALSQIKGKFLLSYNDHPMIRELYKDYNIQTLEIAYQAANMPNAYEGSSNKKQEVVITNY